MSTVVKNRNGEMRIVAAGLVVLAALALSGCSRDNFQRELVRFRNRVIADAAMADAKRALQPNPQDYDGSGYRHAPKPETRSPPARPPTERSIPTGRRRRPIQRPAQTLPGPDPAPPTVYYYPVAPSSAPSP